jgi:CheY-like chemotaxis protein
MQRESHENSSRQRCPFVREIAAARLEKVGYEVVEPASSGEALRLLRAGIVIDALLTDIHLPEASDREVATALP